jgi:hypothetical protein
VRGIRVSIVAVVMAASANALAHPPPPPPVDPPIRHSADIGWTFGGLFAGGYAGLFTAPRATVWLRRGSLRYGVEGTLGRVWLTMLDGTELHPTIPGTYARTGGDVRWTFADIDGQAIAFDVWMQASAGVHVVQWDRGGRMVRPDGLVGLGFTERIGRRHRYGLDVGLSWGMGRGGSGGVARCAGPCDEPTPPVHADFELVEQVDFTADW